MIRLIFISLLLLLFTNCKKQDSINIPVSQYALDWIPEDEDSVKFSDSYYPSEVEPPRRDEFNYLSYATLSSAFIGGDEMIELVTQRAQCTDGTFELSYALEAGIPFPSQVDGSPKKTDRLRINTGTTTNGLLISNTEIVTNFYVLDSLVINDIKYENVLTDSTNFFFSRDEGVISFYNGIKWYYKID